MAKRREVRPWERGEQRRAAEPRHRYQGGWTYRCCAACQRPPEANIHQL